MSFSLELPCSAAGARERLESACDFDSQGGDGSGLRPLWGSVGDIWFGVRANRNAGTPLVLTGMRLWLESYIATLCAVAPIAIVVTRIVLDERFLRRELPGYRKYTARVPYRLLPRIW